MRRKSVCFIYCSYCNGSKDLSLAEISIDPRIGVWWGYGGFAPPHLAVIYVAVAWRKVLAQNVLTELDLIKEKTVLRDMERLGVTTYLLQIPCVSFNQGSVMKVAESESETCFSTRQFTQYEGTFVIFLVWEISKSKHSVFKGEPSE